MIKAFGAAARMSTAFLALAGLAAADASACTRVMSNDRGAVLIGRTMDWPESTEPVLTVLPRGMKRDGGMLGPMRLIKDRPATWTSRYGSLVTTVYGLGSADGLNERGLAAHMLFLNAADFGARTPGRPALHAGLWAQYLLDNAATVPEALALLDKVDLVMAEARGSKTTVHLAIEDASGDSAIIEYIGGKRVVHHGRQYRIMTNDPTYDEQLKLLAAQDFSKPSSEMALPGNVNARDRFQRAAYYLAMLPRPANQREGVAGMFAIARNVSVPFGAPYKGFGIYNTEYRTVTDLTNRRYFFELSTAPNVIWLDMNKLNFAAGASPMALDPNDIDLSGDVTARLKPVAAPF